MLTDEEQNFIKYWEANREKQKKLRNQLFIGLPTGLLFGMPVLLNLFIDWNVQVKVITRGQLNVMLLAVLIIVTFISVFSIKHKWDLRELHYRELLEKQRKQNLSS
jgi:hypothetical protein